MNETIDVKKIAAIAEDACKAWVAWCDVTGLKNVSYAEFSASMRELCTLLGINPDGE